MPTELDAASPREEQSAQPREEDEEDASTGVCSGAGWRPRGGVEVVKTIGIDVILSEELESMLEWDVDDMSILSNSC